ncbi:uncharacterized protein HMPREF1541_05316 [Cyphellophora europaea CBS 101466]|uniref:SHSP domain-containing protein n=1 Tax=Cyphellophora europaea (strain CBS 101466) TaxID=1220924 RepID=W2RTQ1_CYPE1|nr:uncharacterized protein HMPREF1541_05316 [Cyphellophora europaea CBS 101466]ETN39094.1 hypothetical protein HMPREF1541_05316 [Cyphellophora europaea CBS 101466]
MAEIPYAAAPFYTDPWTTTWVPQHYPLHHHPFEHTRHAIGHAFKELASFGNPAALPHTLLCPRIDLRESPTEYCIDVELPGLKDKHDMTLKWVSTRTLLLRALVKGEDGGVKTEEAEAEKKEEEEMVKKEGEEEKPENEANGEEAKPKEDPGYFMTVHERKTGVYGRAFNFPVDVSHDGATAELEAGVLKILVPKILDRERVDKEVHKVEVKKPAQMDWLAFAPM